MERRAKRRRIDEDHVVAQDTDAIRTTHDLGTALRFKKTSSLEVKQGIRKFKDFLTSINACESTAQQSTKLRLLKEYCDSQSPTEKYAPSFPDIISTWVYAAENRNDAVLSAVPAVLAQFLKLISSYLEFREFGISLCKTLLQRDQLQLLDRGLSAPVIKQHLISPCLRLLTEIVGFDAGVVAQVVFAKRDPLFKRLEILLGERSTGEIDGELDRRKPSPRRLAQRFVLANMKYQDASVKGELIVQGKLLQAFLSGIETDADDIIHDILTAIEKLILDDQSVPRNLKFRFLNTGNLASLLKLYEYEAMPSEAPTSKKVRDEAHRLLLKICTEQGKGVLVQQSGWYPTGYNPEPQTGTAGKGAFVDLGLDSPLIFDEYRDTVPVKNSTLATLAKSLTPSQDTLQADLLLRIFEAAPELVAEFFSKRTKFVSPPKDDPDWRGQFAFLFSVCQLPVPVHCGWQDKLPTMPPPVSIVIESILPRPFDRSMLMKSLNLNQDIFTMSAARVMTVALQKLQSILGIFRSSAHNQSLWTQAASRLMEAVLHRIPALKDVAAAAQGVPKGNEQLRGVLHQCLAQYTKTMPQSASSAKIDGPKLLAEALQKLDAEELSKESRSNILGQIPDLLSIAEVLPSARWWQQSKPANLTPLTLLLKYCVQSDIEAVVLSQSKRALNNILVENGILQPSGKARDALLTSLTRSKKWTPEPASFEFIDNCMSRVVQHPVRYMDMLQTAQQEISDKKALSLLACCVAEQWPHVAKNPEKEARKNIAGWIARFFNTLDQIGENYRVMVSLQEHMMQASDEKLKSILQKASERQQSKPLTVDIIEVEAETHPISVAQPTLAKSTSLILDLYAIFGPPPITPTSLEGLDRWDNGDIDSAIISGRLGRLLQCTASLEEETRRQTYHTILTLVRIVETSTYAEKAQLVLLLGEMLETIKAHSPDFSQPLPSVAAELAVQLLRVLNDPADRMYGKVNRFLLRGPSWALDRLISYWVDKVLLSEPENDDGHHLEVDRLLQILQGGLRTKADLDVYRRSGVWERVLGLVVSPACTAQARRRVFGLVWRAMGIESGKAMLMRRVGVKAWLDMVKARVEGENKLIVEALMKEMEAVEDEDEVREWMGKIPLLTRREQGGDIE